jgi:hypothetical protein
MPLRRVNDPRKLSFDHVNGVAVTVKSVGENQRHVGILYKSVYKKKETVLILHLAWHFDLRNEFPDFDHLWIEPVADPERLPQVAALCRRIWQTNSLGIPYAFDTPSRCFDSTTGEFLIGSESIGLTCSSFVLSVFQVAGLPLAEYSTWPPDREGDSTWRNQVIEGLKRSSAPREHVAAVSSRQVGVRFRPEDVAGAAGSPDIPAAYETVQPISNAIVELLNTRRSQVSRADSPVGTSTEPVNPT